MEDMTNLHVRLKKQTHRLFASACALKGVKMADIVREAIDKFIEENETGESQ